MDISAKFSLPLPSHTALAQPAVEHAFGGTGLFSAPAGYLHTDRLSALVQETQAPILWLRADVQDSDPATFYISLATGLFQGFPAVSQKALSAMRQQPAALYGWGQLYSGMARDLSDALHDPPTAASSRQGTAAQNSPFTLVIEHIDQMNGSPATQAVLWEHFLPLLPPGSTRILTCHTAPPRAAIPAYVQVFGASTLRMDEHACLVLAHESGVRLPPRHLRQMVKLAEGREVVLAILLSACQLYGCDAIINILDAASGPRDLMVRLARSFLDTSPPGTADALALAQRLEYLQPALLQAALGVYPRPSAFFFQMFPGNNFRLRCIWQEHLRAAIRPGEVQGRDALLRAARYLASQKEKERAIPLLLDLGQHDEAAQIIDQMTEAMMDRGQWDTLSAWMRRLPEPVRHTWPWLTYAEGELAAAHGQAKAARKTLALAGRLFEKHSDRKGVCQSLLTESCLAAWQKDLPRAQDCALRVRAIAEASGLTWYLAWADWQIGCLAASEGRLTDALDRFTRAASMAETLADAQMTSFIQQVRDLVQIQVEQSNKKDQYIQAYYEADRAEREAAGRLRFLLENPAIQAGDPREPYNWTRTTLLLKLPAETPPSPKVGTEKLLGLLRGILHPAGELPVPENVPWKAPVSPPDSAQEPAVIEETGRATSILPPGSAATNLPESGISNARETPREAQIYAYLLGSFHVMIKEQNLDALPSGRGRVVFSYLLLQHGHPIPRDVIMDTLWPDAAPESARNSLNVAVYSLRQALKSVIDIPVILFQENTYFLNPALVSWLDAAEFENHVTNGRLNEVNGKMTEATQEFEKALSLYQGDLLSDFPYEDWVIVERERMRVLFLDTLDRLSLIYFNQGQYAACVTLCQRILAQDTCREDTHCRLMRCYSRQNQNHLALRQYQACVEALRRDLDVDPAPSTQSLSEKIRRREAV